MMIGLYLHPSMIPRQFQDSFRRHFIPRRNIEKEEKFSWRKVLQNFHSIFLYYVMTIYDCFVLDYST
ncbi:hypothetical protein RIR_jg1319.t1 [Rhizophagus irregularis DAOM 181602=DAOM 197198]|nr:hypothetical protein RIR_jg1319.t1 [Rhizophagus irregularis DAOM 181602=DAOM 197198]